MNLINDTQYCGHCVNKYSSVKKIELIIEIKRLEAEQEDLLKLVKTAFNILSIMNIITTFTTFGGPKSITTFILINALYTQDVHSDRRKRRRIRPETTIKRLKSCRKRALFLIDLEP